MGKFTKFAFNSQPDFDEAAMRQVFAKAVPLKTVVIYCYDPRAARIPELVADRLGETYPGFLVLDAEGRKVASTTNVFPIIVAGGRAHDALRSIAVAQHLFGIENVAVVHHSQCGATTFTADEIIDAFHDEQHADISRVFPRDALCIADYEQSIRSDVELLRVHPGVPRSATVLGFFYEIDSGELIEIARAPGNGP